MKNMEPDKVAQIITSIVAVCVSSYAIIISRRFAQKNVRLTIQQAIFKTVSEKVKDCNIMWVNEPEIEKNNPLSPHFLIMSELTISKELIDKALELFGENYKGIHKYESDYFYLFWKQLRPDLRGWFRRTPEIAKTVNDEYYNDLIRDLFDKFERHFETVK